MEESEKMVALKKAYAEIILNTAKEAAARVMVSERKAHEYLHDLSSTKEEALRLLIRLKKTMDAKIIEVETKSQDQQRKIEVLEAQLQEAEDIVSSLREELNDAHVKIDRLADSRLHSRLNTTAKDENDIAESLPEKRSSDVVVASQAARINNGLHGDSSINNSLVGFGCSGELEIPSIISRRKESELHLNKCTQRIHKCNGNLSKDHSSVAEESDHLKTEKARREDDKSQISCLRSMKTPVVDDKPFTEEEEPVGGEEADDEEAVNIMQVLKTLIKRKKYKRNSMSPSKRVSVAAEEISCDHLRSSHDMHGSGDGDNITQLKSLLVSPFDNSEAVMVSATQQSPFGDSLDALGSCPELEMKSVPSLNVDVKLMDTSDELSSPPSKDRVLKYTFQRKRKRDSAVNDDNSQLHEGKPMEKIVKKQNGNLELVKPGEMTETLCDGRGMTQVAHQLVSMSDKKWIK